MKVKSRLVAKASEHILFHDEFGPALRVIVNDLKNRIMKVSWLNGELDADETLYTGCPVWAWETLEEFCRERKLECPAPPGDMRSFGLIW